MQAVLDRPVTAVEGEQTFWIGPFLGEAGDEVDRFGGGLTVLHGQALAGDARDLSDMGEVEIVVEAGGGLEGAGFNPSVGFFEGGMRRGKNPPRGGL